MLDNIACFRKGCSWTVPALVFLIILCIVSDQIGAQEPVGSISGRVTRDGDGIGISNVRIDVYNANWGLVKSLWTDTSGNYMGTLTEDSYYLATLNEQGYIDEYYNNVTKAGSSWPPAGVTAVNVIIGSETPNINFGLSEGGSISGRVVKDLDGTGIPNVEVDVYDENWRYLNSTFTDSSGYYRAMGLPGGGGFPMGRYYLATLNGQGYIDEYYDNVTMAGSSWPPVGATAVGVTNLFDTSDTNFELSGGGAILINDGDMYTNASSVILSISASGITEMCLSNENSCTSWETFSKSKNWSLDPKSGKKTVFGWFKDGLGNATFGPVMDSIFLDTIAPAGTVVINSEAINTEIPQVVLTLSAKDNLSGVSQMRFSNSRAAWVDWECQTISKWSDWEDYATSRSWVLSPKKGPKTVYVQFKDRAGNESSSFYAEIELTGGVEILDPPLDFDGDGKADLAIYRPSWGGAWLIKASTEGYIGKGWGGMAGDIPVPGDYDGDGITDVAIYRTAWGGAWLIDGSSAGFIGKGWGGMAGDIPVPGDYDGDGKTDIAIYCPAWGGAWLIDGSSAGFIGKGWGGMAGDIPVPGDYDGDGKTDIAIYRPAWGGAWLIDGSSAGFIGKGWGGMAGDIPVPGDYDGDGITDVAIYRPAWGGAWLIDGSSAGFIGEGWGGIDGDIPVPGDYDGDGKVDVAIYRPGTGEWLIILSSTGVPDVVTWRDDPSSWGSDLSDIPLNATTILYYY